MVPPLCLCFVESKPRLYGLYVDARDLGVRPSDLIGVAYPWVALDFDRACTAFGKHVEIEVDQARRDAQTAARDSKRKIDPARIQAAAEERFNELVLGIRKRTITVWSLRHNCPLRIVEQIETDQDGIERWVRLSEALDTGSGARGPGIPPSAS